jgi:peptidyl-prolyl cis-trans isomerase B (cyclophilin B)
MKMRNLLSLLILVLISGVFAVSCKSSATPVSGPTAVIETDYGTIKIKLAPDVAPKSVEHFVKLTRDGFYNGLGFHRADLGLLIQGGDPTSRENDRSKWGKGEPGQETVPAEFSSTPFTRGTVGMARRSDINSAASQFFICLRDFPQWNGQYTVFGEVVDGIDVVERLSKLPTSDPYSGTLLEKVVMKRVSIEN